ncbi:Carboxymethylenebutenolidase [Saezia sanguinis]|uniref:Carboxymethylenebutenolidase n=1 Tax=Saezia sanguinis TaxID=1965230 RepID=A0A433SAA6_9BURK|nr:dienelactone hydrolase family protein [Saezia sanguinis]RUS65687.1 Carboxymethylenebutenolidase [Saezia sanguinis]
MGAQIQLTAADGHTFSAYVAQPQSGQAKASVVVLQEIFGVNSHIRSVADRFAAAGYQAIAPALFDRIRPGIELTYEGPDLEKGRAYKAATDPAKALLDVAAAVEQGRAVGKVGAVGFCWGGLLAWMGASELAGLSAAVVYYGGGVPNNADLQPKCPVLAHFGEHDKHIPVDAVKQFAQLQPAVDVHIYDADHGFNCDQRGSFDAAASALAWERTTAFLAAHLK